jgi:prolyl-tRNA editing enzyme YbaK/EbsC (Cys-tRNA(Pro) deacylase)
MHERNKLVSAAVAAAGIGTSITLLDGDARTAVSASHRLGCEVGAIANSLLFDCGGEPLLVMSSGAGRVNTELVSHRLGLVELRMATPEFVLRVTGQAIGGVAPTGHPRRLGTVIDRSLANYPLIWTAAGTPDSVMSMTFLQLLSLTQGVAIRVR